MELWRLLTIAIFSKNTLAIHIIILNSLLNLTIFLKFHLYFPSVIKGVKMYYVNDVLEKHVAFFIAPHSL